MKLVFIFVTMSASSFILTNSTKQNNRREKKNLEYEEKVEGSGGK